MGEISSDLKKFKETIDSKPEKMNAMCTDIVNKYSNLTNVAKQVQSKINDNYNSANKSIIIDRTNRVLEIYNKISASVDSDLRGMVSDADSIVEMVTKLETINKEIEEQKAIMNRNSGDDETSQSNRNSAQNAIYQKNNEFSDIHAEAIKKLNSLKTKDEEISFVEEFSVSNYEANRDALEYGTYETRTFTSSNGTTIEYSIYVPDYGVEVDKLPVMLYMHGGSNTSGNNDWRSYGLNSYIQNKQITPSGIVIMPHITNFNDTQTLKELTDYVVAEYNCDTNRISVSGHSYGGITAYTMINRYPDYFSCAVPISGTNYDLIDAKSFSNIKVWALGGSYEGGSGNCSTTVGKKAVDRIISLGGEAFFTVIGGGHADANKKAFSQEYESPDGEMINPMEWAFQQVKA